MKRVVKIAALAAVASMGIWAANAPGGDVRVGVDIRIGEPLPPPPAVIVHETVVEEAWIVGPRRRVYDADLRLRLAQHAEYRAWVELEAAREHLGKARAADGASEAAERARVRLREAEARAGKLQDDLDAAHEEVFTCRRRLTDASEEVCIALHERDEGLWLCHRDE